MKRIFKFIFSQEVIFVLFLYAGFFKEAVSFPIDLTVFLMVLSMLLAFVTLFKGQRLSKIQFEAIGVFSHLSLLVGISVLYSASPVAYDKGLRFMIIAGWSFIGAILIIKDKDSLKRFFKGFIGLGVVTTFFAIKEYMTGDRIGSVMVFGSDYLALGRVVGTSAIILFCNLVLKKMKFKTRLLGFVVLISMLVSMVVSGGRGPILFLLVTFAIFLLFNVRLTKGYLFMLAALSGATFYLLKTSSDIFNTLLIRIGHALNRSDHGSSISGRIDRFDTAFEMINNKPIFGYGIDGFTKVYNSRPNEYPHNIFLEITSELGFIGLIIFSSILFLMSFRFWNHYRFVKYGENKILAWICISLFLYHFLNANVSGSLLGNRVMFTFVALLWIFKKIIPKNTNEEGVPKP